MPRLGQVWLGLLVLLIGLGVAGVWLISTASGRDLIHEMRYARFVSGLDGVERRADIGIAMPDGVQLATDVYLPRDRAGPVPAILIRLPYGKTRYWEARHWITLFAQQGYGVVVQDMRGRYKSGGVFAPWPNAAPDGAATLDWIVAQDWSDGGVGTIGCSALGESQIVLAARGHPALKAIVPIGAGGAIGSAGGLYQYFGTFDGGIPTLASLFGWFVNHGGKTGAAMQGPDTIDYGIALRSLPVRATVSRLRSDPTDYEWLLDNFENAPAMAATGYVSGDDRFTVPALLVDGWYDPNVNATLQLAAQMARDGALEHVAIGPGTHCDFGQAFAAGAVGDVPVDPSAAPAMDALYLAFMDHHLRAGPAPDWPRYRAYMLGGDRWISTEDWPPRDAVAQQMFLDGARLNDMPSVTASKRAFRSDPLDPVPTIGGAICCTGNPDLRTGPLDQRPIETRGDLLIWDSEAVVDQLRLTGPVRARLFVSADVADTDLVVRLTDVAPSGASVTIQEGALRLRYRDGVAQPALMQPGQVYEVQVNLRDIAWLLRPGHRLRLHVAGTSFPRLARNPNTGGDPNRDTRMVPARITVWSGPERPSRLWFFVTR